MARKPAVRGTPEERRRAREQQKQDNRAQHVRDQAAKATNGRARVVVACNAALATAKRITEDARIDLSQAIIRAVLDADIPENRKEHP